MVRKLIYLLFFLGGLAQVHAQQLIGYVSVNNTKPYVGQPVQMTVSIYTNTWFTQGVDVGNIQVEGALTVYFRSVPNQRNFNGKMFTGVDFIYNLFPTKAGEITISPLSVNVESPRPGNPKGIKHTITTKEKTLSVKDIPLGINPNDWLVSSSLNVSQTWSAPLKSLKVGDVLQRTITRNAGGTLSEFIPSVVWDSVPGVSIYPKRPITRTNKSKTYVSAFRSESVNYLFEKEGTVTLPKQEFIYWSSRYNKFYKRVIDSITITVAPNPDLGILTGIKKQLEAKTKAEMEPEKKPNLILGMTWQEFLKFLGIGFVLLFLAYRSIKWLSNNFRKRIYAYRNSETYAFTKVQRALMAKNAFKFFNQAKKWLLKLDLEEESLDYFIKHYGALKLEKQYANLKRTIFNPTMSTSINYVVLRKELGMARRKYLKNKATIKNHINRDQQGNWLNPISSGD